MGFLQTPTTSLLSVKEVIYRESLSIRECDRLVNPSLHGPRRTVTGTFQSFCLSTSVKEGEGEATAGQEEVCLAHGRVNLLNALVLPLPG